MKRIILSLTTILTGALLFLSVESAAAQMVNSLYFLEKTPFHMKWNPAMEPSRSGIGVGVSNIGLTVYSDLAFSDIFYPNADGTKLLTVMHPDMVQADKDAFMNGLGDVSNFGMNMNIDLFNLGLKFGKVYFTVGSSMVTDMGIGLPKDLFKLVMSGPGLNGVLDMTDMNINSMSYIKTGAGLSIKLGDMLSVGGNVNYLMGISDIRLGFDNFTINANGSAWNINTQGNLRVIAPSFVKLQYDANDYLDFNNMNQMIDQSSLDNFGTNMPSDVMNNVAGKGLSFDVGLTLKPLKFLTLSAAVIDFGSIKWDPANINQAKSTGTFTFTGTDLSNNAAGSDITSQLVDMMHLKKEANPEAYTSKLTTKINIGAEIGLPSNKLSIGVLSQTGMAENGTYQDFMASLNIKPNSLLQTAFTYSLLHGEMSSLGCAVNLKLLFINLFVAADYVPLKINKQFIPINNSYFNLQTGLNLMF